MKEGYKQTKIGVIPQDWMIDNLGTLSKVYDGTHSTPTYVDEGIPFYSVEQLTTVGFNKTKFISEEVFNKENKRVKLEQGDILMTRIGDIGTARYIDWDVNASFYVSLALIKPLNNECNFKYLSFFINSDIFKNELHKRTLHVAFPKKINLGDISKCLVMLPPIKEQNAIANCLSVWDEAIEKQQKLIEAKEIRHKALMLKLLSGKKRLPGFTDEWKEVKIKDLGEIKTGNTPSKNNSDYWGDEFYWCTADDMKNKYIYHTKLRLSSLGKEKARIVPENSILVTCIASIGINAITKVKTGFNQQINSITPNNDFDVEFIYYLINNNKSKLLEYAGAGALPMLNKNTFMEIAFKIPVLNEQLAISNILKTSEAEIEIEKKKVEQLKEQKKALMQKLLTGKVRLPLNN